MSYPKDGELYYFTLIKQAMGTNQMPPKILSTPNLKPNITKETRSKRTLARNWQEMTYL